jgi:hypothetical protein
MRNADWRDLSRLARLRIDGDGIRASVGSGREQLVRVDETDDGFLISSKILPPRHVRDLPDLTATVFSVNRLSELVGFRIDDRDWLVGEAWVPSAGLTVSEWQFYVQKVATVCDRLEHVLAGVDRQ